MKRKLFGLVTAIGMLFVTSCATDVDNYTTGNGDAVVSFSLNLENGAQTRAISDGTGADMLVYQIYDASGNELSAFERTQVDDISFDYTLTLRLVKGQTYTIAFWAQNSECTAYDTEDLTAVKVDYNGVNNDETRDAFFKTEKITVTGDQALTATLRRPFAQLNLGATENDYEAAVSMGIDIKTSKVVINKAPNTLNLITGEVSGEETVTYGLGTVPASFDTPEVLTVKVKQEGSEEPVETEFAYLSMSYILASAEKATLDDVTFTLHPQAGDDIILSQGLTNVPVQRNWRTNVLGQFLTNTITYTIVIDSDYYGDYNLEDGEFENHTIANGVEFYDNTYYLSGLEGLQWFQQQMNKATNQASTLHETVKKSNEGSKWIFSGQTVMLMTDVDLATVSNWAPIGSGTNGYIFNGTFDGNNHTVSNLKVSVTGDASAGFFAGAIGTIKNLQLSNVTISGQWKAGAISGDGLCTIIENCHVNGGTIASTPNASNDNANNVGGIVGYLSAESNASVSNSSVRNLAIRAYRDVAGIAGTVSGANAYIKDCVVEGINVVADQTVPYVEEGKAANAGEIYGRLVNSASADKVTGSIVNNAKVIVLAPVNGVLNVDFSDPALLPDAKANDGFTEMVIGQNMTGEATKSASYGATAINLDGLTIDGQYNTITITTANANYVSVVNAKSGTLKNATINGAVRALFIGNGVNGDITFENVTVDNTLYAFNSDAGNKEYGVYFKGCTLNGWTSFSNVHKEVVFTDCTFGKGSRSGWDYEFCRPYNPCEFVNCEFKDGFEFDAVGGKTNSVAPQITFRNCTYNGTLLTTDNVSMLLENGIDCPDNLTITNDNVDTTN